MQVWSDLSHMGGGLSQSVRGKTRDKDFKKECLVIGSLSGGVQQRMTSSEEELKPRKKRNLKNWNWNPRCRLSRWSCVSRGFCFVCLICAKTSLSDRSYTVMSDFETQEMGCFLHSSSVLHTLTIWALVKTRHVIDRLTMKMCQSHFSISGGGGFIAPGLYTALHCTWKLELWAQ